MGTPVAMNRLHIMTQENYTYDVLETAGLPMDASKDCFEFWLARMCQFQD